MARSSLGVVLDRLCHLADGQAAAGASDRQLLERFVARREADAFTALVQRHGPMVFGVCRRLLRNMLLARVKVTAGVALVLSALAAVGFGAGRATDEKPPPVAEAPAARQDRDGAKPASAPSVVVDAFGDPLPEDALARLGTTRLRHGATAFAIDFSPDGRALASATPLEGVVHVWETAAGKELAPISLGKNRFGGVESAVGIAYAPDGKTLAGALMNGPPCLWDVATGKEVRRFGEGESRARWVVFSPDGKTLAFDDGGQDKRVVRLAEVSSGKEQRRLEGLKGNMSRAAFSPDGKAVAVADDEAIHLFDRAAGRSQDVPWPEDGKGSFGCPVFSPDGKTLAAISKANRGIWLVEVATRKTLRRIALGKKEGGCRIAFLPDGKTMVSSHADGFVRFWDIASGEKTRQFRAHSSPIVGLALSRDGRTLATSCNDSNIGNHTVRLWETATGKPLARYPVPEAGIARVIFSPDGRRVATASWEGALHLWEAASGKLLRRWDQFGSPAFTADGKTLLFGGWEDGKIHFLDLATDKETRQFEAHAKGVWEMSLSRDGKLLATAGTDQFLRLWDPATGRQLQDFGGKQKAALLHVALTADGKLLAATSSDHAVRVWETAGGKLVREYTEADDTGGLAISPDGRLLAWSGSDGPGKPSIRVRDLVSGKSVHELKGQGDPLSCLAFSPDGRSLVWGGQWHREMSLFEVATGQLRRTFTGHRVEVTCVAFSLNGRLMASGGSDASVVLWAAAGQRQPPPPAPLSETDLDRLWDDLAANDAATAYGAICALRASPRQAVRLLERHLKPQPEADAKRIARALRDLDSDEFAIRERAAKELADVAEAAEPALRRALDGKPSAEVRRRLEQLFGQIEAAAGGRRPRALEVLEQIDSAESRRLLAALTHGAPGARLTREARAALDRAGGAPE
jgi:WD40 repeat protein